ncbi:MAG: hypothetical protein NVSMB28_00220 [Collimonas sp.]
MKPLRVALSGSGFKFPAHVGALLAIRDAGYTPVEIAGTSGGSIVATLAASGMPLDAMCKLTLSHDWSGMLSFSPWSLLTNLGYCSGNALLDWITKNTGGKTFADLDIDLIVMASNVATEQPFEFSKTATPNVPVALAARASASIPFVYAPVTMGNMDNTADTPVMLMDGGMVNNIPVDKLTVDAIPRIGIQLVAKQSSLGAGTHSIFDIAPRVIDQILSANENTHVELDEQDGAKFAFVETSYASGLDRNMPPAIRTRLMQGGYETTKNALAALA